MSEPITVERIQHEASGGDEGEKAVAAARAKGSAKKAAGSQTAAGESTQTTLDSVGKKVKKK